MNLGNTLYAKMLQHRLQQQQLDQQNYQQAMEVANQNAMEAAQLEDREFERSKELAKLQGETAAMLDRPDPDFEDGELNPYARHARNAWRRDTAEKLAARDFQRQKHEQDLQAKMFGITYPHSPEVMDRKLENEIRSDASRIDNDTAAKEYLLGLKTEAGLDEQGRPLPASTEFGPAYADLMSAKEIVANPQMHNGARVLIATKLENLILKTMHDAKVKGLGAAWVSRALTKNPDYIKLKSQLETTGYRGRNQLPQDSAGAVSPSGAVQPSSDITDEDIANFEGAGGIVE